MKIISHGHVPVTEPRPAERSDVDSARERMEGFELGAFLLRNLGLNGHWTSYVLLHPDTGRLSGQSSDGSPLSALESWLLDRCPIFLATQERFRIFKGITQELLRDGMRCASIPCGLMDDLLSLDYTAVRDVHLTGIDLDAASLKEATVKHQVLNPSVPVDFKQADAWALPPERSWDLITSNGLNIYVEDDAECIDLYASFARALRPGGHLVVSFITPPETWTPYNQEDLTFQRELFTRAVPVKWQCVRTEDLTRSQLEVAGFRVKSIHYDGQRMFPAVLAQRI